MLFVGLGFLGGLLGLVVGVIGYSCLLLGERFV